MSYQVPNAAELLKKHSIDFTQFFNEVVADITHDDLHQTLLVIKQLFVVIIQFNLFSVPVVIMIHLV